MTVRPLGASGKGQTVVSAVEELEAVLEDIPAEEMATYGLVLEESLRQVTTMSVGHITVDGLTVSLPLTTNFITGGGYLGQVFIPLTVGGGVRSAADVDRLLRAGADKVSLNTAAIARPELLAEAAHRFGSQCVVLSVDARRAAGAALPSGFEVTTHGGRRGTGIDAVEWATRAVGLGVGEILLNSMDADGTKAGFDLELIQAIRAAVTVPVIASGGAGELAHFPPAVAAGADAVLAASVFHFGELRIGEVKDALRAAGQPVR